MAWWAGSSRRCRCCASWLRPATQLLVSRRAARREGRWSLRLRAAAVPPAPMTGAGGSVDAAVPCSRLWLCVYAAFPTPFRVAVRRRLATSSSKRGATHAKRVFCVFLRFFAFLVARCRFLLEFQNTRRNAFFARCHFLFEFQRSNICQDRPGTNIRKRCLLVKRGAFCA
jgi:hypothetical protein